MKDGVNNKVITCSVNTSGQHTLKDLFIFCCNFIVFYHIKQLN